MDQPDNQPEFIGYKVVGGPIPQDFVIPLRVGTERFIYPYTLDNHRIGRALYEVNGNSIVYLNDLQIV